VNGKVNLAELEFETMRIALGFFLLTFCIHPTAAYSPIRGLQEETPISNEEVSIESYFILDVVAAL
jgi:hypothetical protein